MTKLGKKYVENETFTLMRAETAVYSVDNVKALSLLQPQLEFLANSELDSDCSRSVERVL